MATVVNYEEVVRCVKHELELTGISDDKNAKPDLSYLLPELRFTVIETLLLHTRGNQTQAARMLGLNRRTLRNIYTQYHK